MDNLSFDNVVRLPTPENIRERELNNRVPVKIGILMDKTDEPVMLRLLRDIIALKGILQNGEVLRLVSPNADTLAKLLPVSLDVEFANNLEPGYPVVVYYMEKKPDVPSGLKADFYKFCGDPGVNRIKMTRNNPNPSFIQPPTERPLPPNMSPNTKVDIWRNPDPYNTMLNWFI